MVARDTHVSTADYTSEYLLFFDGRTTDALPTVSLSGKKPRQIRSCPRDFVGHVLASADMAKWNASLVFARESASARDRRWSSSREVSFMGMTGEWQG